LNQDFTYGKNFADFLGSFWSQLFDDGALGTSVGYASSEILAQGYMDLMEIISTSSIDNVPVLSRKNIFPLSILRSKFTKISEIPEYGGGGYFGLQPSNSRYVEGSYLSYGRSALLQEPFFYPITDSSIMDLGGVAINRLFEPSVVLGKNTDFLFVSDGVIFREDIFENNLFPKREIINVETGELDEEIVVWFCDVSEDRKYLFSQYGYLFSSYQKSTEDYKRAIQAVFRLVSGGTNIFRLDAFLSSISGSPIIREASETVEKINIGPEGTLVITDKNVYSLRSIEDLRTNIKTGSVLRGGTPLSNAVEIVNTKERYWWQKFLSIPLKNGGTSNTQSFLAFPNRLEKATYGKLLFLGNPESCSIKFSLVGSNEALDSFWNSVFKKAKESELLYGYELFKKYSNSSQPSEDFESKEDFFVNPAQIFADDLAPGAILPIKVNLSKVRDPEFFFGSVNPLTSNCPVHLILMLFFTSELNETKDLGNAHQPLTATDNIDLRDLLSQDVKNYPTPEKKIWTFDVEDERIKEGLSWGKSFGNIAQSSDPNYSDRFIEYFDLSNTSNLVQNIELKLIKKCKQ